MECVVVFAHTNSPKMGIKLYYDNALKPTQEQLEKIVCRLDYVKLCCALINTTLNEVVMKKT